MPEYEILIEENAFGAIRPVKVHMDIPISTLLPELVEALHLPRADLFGNELVYGLYHATSGRLLPVQQTLEAAGILPGMRLMLDALPSERIAIPVVSQSMNAFASPQPSKNYNLHGSETLSDGALLPAFAPEQFEAVPEKTMPQPHKSRRAFLVSCGIVLGASGIGVGYAAYRGVLNPGFLATNLLHTAVGQPKTLPSKKAPVTKKAAPVPFTVKVNMTFKKHQNTVRVVAWSPLGKVLASGADDSHVLIWDPQGDVQQDLLHPAAVNALALSPDGAMVVTGSNNQVAFWSTLTGKKVSLAAHQHTQQVTDLAWTTKNAQQIVSVAEDKHAIIWNSQSFQPSLTYLKHTAALMAVAWSPDGKTVASASQGGVIHVWSAADGQDLHGFYQDATVPMRSIAFDTVGTRLAVGGDDGIIRLWNGLTCTNNGQQCMDTPQRITLAKTPVRALAWSPDGRFLALGMSNGTFQLLQTAQNMKQAFAQNLGNIVHSIAWSSDSKQVATAVGKQVIVWDVA
jgi:Anaphase-promoting complex subunit 4 WD40 domain/WD domain, G-beta repeat